MIVRLSQLAAPFPLACALLLLACAYLLLIAIWLSVIDLRHHLLPNSIVYPSMGIAVSLLVSAAFFSGDGAAALRTLLGGGVLGFGYLALRAIYPAGMGLGDVKLALVLGCYLGYLSWSHLLYATVATFLLGGLAGFLLLLSRRGTLKSALPFGPMMFAGTLLALLIPA